MSLLIEEIPPGRSLAPFVRLAWQANAGDPYWVPPLRLTVRALLDRRRHPFHRHADVIYLLARRDGHAVARLAAGIDRLANEMRHQRAGFFGFFDVAGVDEEAVQALMGDAAAWLRARGMDVMRGPFNLSTNYECGVLVDGFDSPPALMMPHNPPFYGPLLERAGLRPVKDLLAYRFEDPRPPERLMRAVDRLMRRERVRVRSVDLRHFAREVAVVRQIYNAAWDRNWGFVPMTDAEFDAMARTMRPIVDPELCLIAEIAGEPAGFSLSLPDLNQALRCVPTGRLLPFGFLRLLWQKRRIDAFRCLTLGVVPRFQRYGLGAALYLRTWETGARKGYRSAEASWILEENRDIRSLIESLGGRLVKRYRLYEMMLD